MWINSNRVRDGKLHEQDESALSTDQQIKEKESEVRILGGDL